jgi:glycosyltransferase involved in cell wall biosynthesis
MRILLVQDTDWINKGPLQQNHLMEKLSLNGHQIRVIDHEILWKEEKKRTLVSKRELFPNISRIYDGAKVDLIRPGIIKIQNLDYVSVFVSRKIEIERQIKEFRPDVIIGFQILSAYLGMSAANKHSIPFIYYWIDTYHSQLPNKLFQIMGKLLEQKTLKGAQRVVAINEQLRDYVVMLGSDPQKTYINRGSVDLARFNTEIDTSEIKRKYKIKDSDKVICFVGMIHRDLGLKEIIIGISKMKNHNIKLLIVGKGDQHWPNAEEELKEAAVQFGVEDKVIISGKVSYQEVPKFMNVASICILPAYSSDLMRDIVPIKMYEYMSMGKPVISTKLPGVFKEFKEQNGVHYVDTPDDILAKAIELIEANKIQEEGTKARYFVAKNSWDDVVCEFDKILEDVSAT